MTDSEVALLLDRESLGVLSSHVSHASILEATDGATDGVFECFDAFLMGFPKTEYSLCVVFLSGLRGRA